jgi:hypothetical protein
MGLHVTIPTSAQRVETSPSSLHLYRTCRQCKQGPTRVRVDRNDGQFYCEDCWLDYESSR